MTFSDLQNLKSNSKRLKLLFVRVFFRNGLGENELKSTAFFKKIIYNEDKASSASGCDEGPELCVPCTRDRIGHSEGVIREMAVVESRILKKKTKFCHKIEDSDLDGRT